MNYVIGCYCHTCKEHEGKGPKALDLGNSQFALIHSSGPMVLCPSCGNKRCPKATYHENECTNSNEPGQTGSIYG